MCNNIDANKICKKEEKKTSNEIVDHIFHDRPISSRNILAKALKTKENGKISYRKGHPLKLGDKSRVYEIYSVPVENNKKEFKVVFCFDGKSKKETTSFLRNSKDRLIDVEEFLLHAYSVYELRNIDLRYN